MIEFRFGLIDLKNPTNSVSIGVGVAVDTDTEATRRDADSRSADEGDEPGSRDGREDARAYRPKSVDVERNERTFGSSSSSSSKQL